MKAMHRAPKLILWLMTWVTLAGALGAPLGGKCFEAPGELCPIAPGLPCPPRCTDAPFVTATAIAPALGTGQGACNEASCVWVSLDTLAQNAPTAVTAPNETPACVVPASFRFLPITRAVIPAYDANAPPRPRRASISARSPRGPPLCA